MELVAIALPVAIFVGAIALAAFVWAASSDQFEDLETPRAAPSSMKTQCYAVTRPTNDIVQFPITEYLVCSCARRGYL